MIVYFSATGNCEFAAGKIAESTGDRSVSVMEIDAGKIVLGKGEALGIVTPAYFWGLPSCMDDFLRDVEIVVGSDEPYIYCVASFGSTTGQVDGFVRKHLKKKGLRLSASYGLKTVDNWTVIFSVNDTEKIAGELESESLQIEEIIEDVRDRKKVFIGRDKKKSVFMCNCARHFYRKARKTKHLHVEEACVGCGLCEKGCPVKAIEIQDGKPVWVKDKCAMCFRCLHRCPAFAIQYDDKTKQNGQYVHP